MTDDDRLEMAAAAHGILEMFRPVVEIVEGMVSTFKAQGFTEEQAREIVTAIFRQQGGSPKN